MGGHAPFYVKHKALYNIVCVYKIKRCSSGQLTLQSCEWYLLRGRGLRATY